MSCQVEFQPWNVEFHHQIVVVAAVGARFGGTFAVGKHVEVFVDHVFQWLNHCKEFLAHWHLAARAARLWRAYHKLGVPVFTFDEVYAPYGAVHRYHALGHIKVAPAQGAHLANAQPGAKANVYSKSAESEMAAYVVHDFAVVGRRQHLHFLSVGGGGVFYIPFVMAHPLMLYPEPHHHFEHYQNIPDGLHAQPAFKLSQDEGLHCLLGQRIAAAEVWQQVFLQNQHVGRHR